MRIQGTNFNIQSIQGADPVDPQTDNLDLEVTLEDGDRYVATLFTLANIRRIMDQYRNTGECNNGQYFWASDMVIVHDLTEETIKSTVEDLLATGEFNKAFSGPIDS
jgi:hypothetical protein